ncbi:MAG: rRNA pseudouridine synthase, partial [Actinobacteria bacterium]|nr:rRNA pseudouridine synthase [Actinomycetota bacterium]
MNELRLSKFLSESGIASRRKAEDLIASGRVSVDGKVIREQGLKIDPINSKVTVDGETIKQNHSKTYIAFHKPRGVLSTMSDPEGRDSLAQYFGSRNERLFHVGRLDKESEGLILLTNDGHWANRVAHPSHGVIKKYLV